jgi:S1-C subfamily serine protease
MQTEPSPLAAFSAAVNALANRAAPSVVAVADGGRAFSGFLWRPDLVATASDALRARRGEKVSLALTGEETIEGVVVGRDPTTALALIRAAQPGPTLQASADAAPALGDVVLAVGRTPHGAACALGSIALAGGPWRSMRGGDISRRIWLDVRLTQHLEGGAVLDATGRLLGMAVAGPRRRVVLVPIETIERVGEELVVHGRARRGYLGVSVESVRLGAPAGTESERGLVVLALDPSGPAARAGMLQGDIIVGFDGQAAPSPRALGRMLPASSIGRAIPLDFVRAGARLRISVPVGEKPAA